jgi:predicted dehydrogenase
VKAPVRWGLLATSALGRTVVEAVRGSERTRFVAVASPDAGRAAVFAGAAGLPVSYGSYERLLAAPDIDAVFVVAPAPVRPQWTMRALRAGKHVLCAKPAATTAEAARCFDIAAQEGIHFAEGPVYRRHPQTALARSLVASGAIGRLRHIRAALRRSTGDPGGALTDLGCYCSSAVRLFGGEPVRVAAERAVDGGVDTRFAALLRLPGDVLATFDAGLDQFRADELDLVGTTGRLRVPDPWLCRGGHLELEHGDGMVRRVPVPRADPYRLELDAFSTAVRGEGGLEFGRADAVAQAALLERLRAAAA